MKNKNQTTWVNAVLTPFGPVAGRTDNASKTRARLARAIAFVIGIVVVIASVVTSSAAQVTLLSETFEGNFPIDNGWTVGDANASGTPAYWDDVNSGFGGEGTHGGAWKGYCAGIGYAGTTTSPTYINAMSSYMSKQLNFSGYSTVSLVFWYKIPSIEACCDVAGVYVDNTPVWFTQSAVAGWTPITVNLNAYVGGSHTLKFQFDSDSSSVGEGWYLDDLAVTATTGQPDLAKSSDSLSNTTPNAGDTVTASITIQNQPCSGGSTSAGASHLGLYWSATTSFSGVSAFYEIPVASVAANGTIALNQNITIDPTTTAGTYYLGYKIDDQNEVTECDEQNNGINYWTITVSPVAEPEINVQGNGITIVDGDTTPSTADWTDFSTTSVGTPVNRTFWVYNTGTAPLTPGMIAVPSGFTLTVGLVASIAAGGSDFFTVQLSGTAAGTYAGDITIPNNDANESPYNFKITGNVAAQPTLVDAECFVTPTNVAAGGQLTVNYRIYNPNSASVIVGLGCSIRTNGTIAWYSDPAHDVYRTVPAGYSTQTRIFDVPSRSQGSFDVGFGLWQTIGTGSPYYTVAKPSQFTVTKHPTWLLLYYMCNGAGGGGDLDPYIPAKFSTVATNLSDNAEAFMLVDRSGPGMDRVFRLKHDSDMSHYTDGVDRWTPAQIGLSGNEFDTGKTNTINAFCDFVISQSGISADHCALIVFNHGGGISPTIVGDLNGAPVTTGICWDDNGGYLSVSDLGRAVEHLKTGLGRKLDVLHLDACLMQMLEVNYQIRDCVDYFVASENEGWAGASTWETYVNSITASTSAETLAESMASSYFAWKSIETNGRTIAVTRPSEVTPISSAVDALAFILMNNMANERANITMAQNRSQKFAYQSDVSWCMNPDNYFIDLRDFCEELAQRSTVPAIQSAANAVITAIGNAGGSFLVSEQHANGHGATQDNGFWFDRGTFGLSIFFPRENTWPTYSNYLNNSSTPANLAFTASTRWDEFLRAYFSGDVQFKSSTYTVTENCGSARIYVSRTGGSSGQATVNYTTANGTATAGNDYTAKSGTLNWSDGDASDMYFDVPITDDSLLETGEAFRVDLSGASGVSLGSPVTTTITIVDNETPPRGNAQFISSAYSVSESGGSVRIYVTRTGGSFGAASVNYATINGTASAGSDYIANSGTLNWADGDVGDKFFDVVITDDVEVENAETFAAAISGATGVNLGITTMTTITVNDNDAAPVYISAPTVSNGIFGFVVNGPFGNFVTEVSSNLVTWSPGWTNTMPIGGSVLVIPPKFTNQEQLFYRVVMP